METWNEVRGGLRLRMPEGKKKKVARGEKIEGYSLKEKK